MCVVSMVGDHYNEKWRDLFPMPFPNEPFQPQIEPLLPSISRKEFEQLKREVEDLKKLLERAKAYDEANNEPNCEIEDKMKFLKEVAKLVGVDLDEVLNKKENG